MIKKREDWEFKGKKKRLRKEKKKKYKRRVLNNLRTWELRGERRDNMTLQNDLWNFFPTCVHDDEDQSWLQHHDKMSGNRYYFLLFLKSASHLLEGRKNEKIYAICRLLLLDEQYKLESYLNLRNIVKKEKYTILITLSHIHNQYHQVIMGRKMLSINKFRGKKR